jgi:hypothetical protein
VVAFPEKIVSGGQTGADHAALGWANANGCAAWRLVSARPQSLGWGNW